MTATITLFCNGCADACPNTFVVTGGNTTEARTAAQAGGWRHNPPLGNDYCPRCVVECRTSHLRSGIACRTCAVHPDLPFRSLLGHDHVGHRAANALARYGVRNLRSLQVIPNSMLDSIPGLGEAGRDRALNVLELHPDHPSTQGSGSE